MKQGLFTEKDCLNYKLLLQVYCFNRPVLELVYDYLWNRNSKSRLMNLSAQAGVKYWCATGFCFGPFLFDTFVNDHFFPVEDAEIYNYTDGMTTYVCDHELENIVSKLESDPEKVSEWFCDINMKLNAEKYHILIF